MSEQAIKARGCGRIQVSAALWVALGKPETPEAWHKALLLPENYEVERVEQAVNGVYNAWVLSEDILTVIGAERVSPVDVIPNYRRDEEGRVAIYDEQKVYHRS